MNRIEIPELNPLPSFPYLLNLNLGKREGCKFVKPPFFYILVRVKSDENNILRQAIHLFSNRPISYLLFD